MIDDERWMQVALEQARLAAAMGEVPVGAVIVRDGIEIARAGNRTVHDRDATAHAETLVIREAGTSLGQWRRGHGRLGRRPAPAPAIESSSGSARWSVR